MAYDFILSTTAGTGAHAVIPATRGAIAGATLTVEFASDGDFNNITMTKGATADANNRNVLLDLAPVDVDAVKDDVFRVKAVNGGVTTFVVYGRCAYSSTSATSTASTTTAVLAAHADSAANLVRWAPPAQSNPTVYTVSGVFQQITAGPNEDVLVYGKSGSAATSSFQINGGRHVRIMGGKWAKTNTGATLSISNVTGSVFIEGVEIDASGYNGDAINACGVTSGTLTYPDVYIQNCRIYGVNGTFATTHADVYQPQGPIGRLFVDKFTASSNYQGLFISPQNAISGVFISRSNFTKVANASNPITYQLWFNDGTQNPYPATVDEVYVTGPAGQTVAANLVWPNTGLVGSGGSINGVAVGALSDANGNAYWPNAALISGKVYAGSPVNGDFAPAGAVGIGYVAKGYLTSAPALTQSSSFEQSQGFCYTMPPQFATTSAASGAANRTYFMRLRGSKKGATAVTVLVGTGSGNISVGVYSNNGQSGRSASPGAPKATAGSVAMTTTANSEQTISLGSTIDVVEGDWVGISVDNITATLGRPQANPPAASAFSGLQCAMNSAFPVPTVAPTGVFQTTPFWYAQVT